MKSCSECHGMGKHEEHCPFWDWEIDGEGRRFFRRLVARLFRL